MSTDFVIPATGKPDRFTDNVSKGDVVHYYFDFTPWQEENSSIWAATWTVESGTASLGTTTLASGFADCPVSFPDSGRSLISVLAQTDTEKKKVWLEVFAKDEDLITDDYGLSNG